MEEKAVEIFVYSGFVFGKLKLIGRITPIHGIC
jgi:hypothetical protein